MIIGKYLVFILRSHVNASMGGLDQKIPRPKTKSWAIKKEQDIRLSLRAESIDFKIWNNDLTSKALQ